MRCRQGSFRCFRSQHQPLRREAAAEGQQEPGRSLDSNLSSEQGPYEIGFLAQEAKPSLAIRNESQICGPVVAFGYLQRLFLNHDGGLQFFLAGECEVIGGVQPLGSASLKYEWKPPQEVANRALPGQSVAHSFCFIM